MTKRNSLENWINIPAIMKTGFGEVEGAVKYGFGLSMRPGTTPLQECQPGSRETIKGERPAYWFVSSH